jgi:hypothetical protein
LPAWSKACTLAVVTLFAAACGREAGWFIIPPQQSLDLGMDPGGVRPSVKMSDADAGDYIVRDIDRMPGAWRWAFAHPELRFRLNQAAAWRFTAQIAIPQVTFQVTGPVTVTYLIDGRRLGSIRCAHPGQFEIDQPVPAAWLDPGRYIHVKFETDRPWVSPEDGAQLSFQLLQVGFLK